VSPPAAAVDVVGRAIWTSRSIADLALDSLPMGVFVASSDGDRANPELHRIWRRPLGAPFPRRALARSLEPLPPRSKRRATTTEAPDRPLTVALAGQTLAPTRYRLRREDGSTAIVRVSAAPITDDEITVGAVLVATDESIQHDMEGLRDAFLGILGHELRTPTTAIVGGSELLADTDLAADIRAEVAATLVDEATRLNRLVDQLLRLAALEGRDDVSLEPVAVGHVVRRLARQLAQRRPRLTIDVSVEPALAPVAADEGYVEQLAAILFDNAVKHAGERARIGIRVNRVGREIEVHVLDDGPGLPEAGDMLFRLFHRGPVVGAKPSPGTGIGLFVADAIVRALGGRIWAENRAEGGADVAFALPIAEA